MQNSQMVQPSHCTGLMVTNAQVCSKVWQPYLSSEALQTSKISRHSARILNAKGMRHIVAATAFSIPSLILLMYHLHSRNFVNDMAIALYFFRNSIAR